MSTFSKSMAVNSCNARMRTLRICELSNASMHVVSTPSHSLLDHWWVTKVGKGWCHASLKSPSLLGKKVDIG